MTTTPAMMDEAVQRINCYAVGAWLEQWLAALGLPLPTAFSPAGEMSTPRASGLILRIGSLKFAPQLFDRRDLLYITAIEGDATAPIPLGLDVGHETITTARTKLSSSIVGGSPGEFAAGDRRVSFFMDGGRVIELRFVTSLAGFDRILVTRLGEPNDWRNPSER